MSSAPSTSCADCFPTSQERLQRPRTCPGPPIVDQSPLPKGEHCPSVCRKVESVIDEPPAAFAVGHACWRMLPAVTTNCAATVGRPPKVIAVASAIGRVRDPVYPLMILLFAATALKETIGSSRWLAPRYGIPRGAHHCPSKRNRSERCDSVAFGFSHVLSGALLLTGRLAVNSVFATLVNL